MENFEILKENLINRGFSVNIADSRDEAVELLKQLIPESASIGLPGTVTIRGLGIIEELKKSGSQIIDTWEEENPLRRHEQLNADVVLTSVNAITLDGLLVNLDGTGNRVASMCYGPKMVVAVVGSNKITKNLEDAIYRTKNVAAPLSYQRKNSRTPCAKTGVCHDCKTIKTKQCRVMVIHEGRPRGINEFHIILVKAELGY
ncbi:MAG: lactate utilization protein [Peptococcaceae bacterium]